MLIGAGSLQFGLGTVGSILESEVLSGSEIILHDINVEALDLTFNACDAAIKERALDFKISSTLNRKEALKNATFIINSIEITPRFPLMEMDYQVPLQFGCKQISGENGGPGGLFHSLRVIPPILDICKDITDISPNAFLINFSNPMSRICLAIKRRFPKLRFVGLCHEFQHFIPFIQNILDMPLSNLTIKGAGLNHFGVILEIKYKDSGKDAYPDLRAKTPDFFYNYVGYDGFKLTAFILEKYGYIPYTTDSHYGEYLQWAWEKADIPAVRKWWKSYEEKLNFDYNKAVRFIKRGRGVKIVKPDEESAIPIVEGILTDANYIEPSVNIPNDDIIINLPKDLIVECPAIINKDGIHGIKIGEYPKGLAALLNTQACVQDLVVDAILNRSRDLVIQALLADPVIETYWQAKNIFEEFLNLQSEYIQIELE